MLKSFTVYQIRYEQLSSKTVVHVNNYMKNNGVKFRFPHGQWCTAMEKISDEKSKQDDGGDWTATPDRVGPQSLTTEVQTPDDKEVCNVNVKGTKRSHTSQVLSEKKRPFPSASSILFPSANPSRHPDNWHKKRGPEMVSDWEVAKYAVSLRYEDISYIENRQESMLLLMHQDDEQLQNMRSVFVELWLSDNQPRQSHSVWGICTRCFYEADRCTCERRMSYYFASQPSLAPDSQDDSTLTEEQRLEGL